MAYYILGENWEYSETVDGSTGTRKYISEDHLSVIADEDEAIENLPSLGESWNAANPALVVQSISQNYADDNPQCGVLIYTVQYSTKPYPTSDVGDAGNNYPTTVEMSADFQTYSHNKAESTGSGKWLWSADVTASDLKVPKREITTSIVVHKWIRDLNAFLDISTIAVGKVNSSATKDINGIDVGTGTALYLGASASESNDNNGDKRWLVQLKFVVKKVPDNTLPNTWNGWNYVFRPSHNKYYKPYWSLDNSNLYTEVTFKDLLEFGETP